MEGLRIALLEAQKKDSNKTIRGLSDFVYPGFNKIVAHRKIANLIKGSRKSVEVDAVGKICEYLDCKPGDLFVYDEG